MRRHIRESHSNLRKEDFDFARKGRYPDQPVEMSKIVRRDLLEGDIYGLNSQTVQDFIRDANSLSDPVRSPHSSASTYRACFLNLSFFIIQQSVQHSALRNQYQLWSGGVIPYVISSQYDTEARIMIADAINEISRPVRPYIFQIFTFSR